MYVLLVDTERNLKAENYVLLLKIKEKHLKCLCAYST